MKYNRILLKLSGESLQGAQGYGLSTDVLHSYAAQIRQAVEAGVQVAVVIGGGNIFRGLQGAGRGFDRVKGDQMGMLATIINSLALQSALENDGVRARVLTSIRMEPIGEYYAKARALEYLAAGEVVIIGGGTSNPFFTTDSPRPESHGSDRLHALQGEPDADRGLRHGHRRQPDAAARGREDRHAGTPLISKNITFRKYGT